MSVFCTIATHAAPTQVLPVLESSQASPPSLAALLSAILTLQSGQTFAYELYKNVFAVLLVTDTPIIKVVIKKPMAMRLKGSTNPFCLEFLFLGIITIIYTKNV